VTPRVDAAYSRWLQRNATVSLWIYSGLIAVLVPAFHFVLAALPGVPPGSDSMPLRCVAAVWSLVLAGATWLLPALRRHAVALQFASVVVTIVVVAMLIVNSGNHYAYIASGLLVIVGAQQAFYRIFDLALAFGIGFAALAAYSVLQGEASSPAAVAALATFGTGYLVAFIPAALRIRIQHSELYGRLALVRLARFDPLTELANRTTAHEMLEAEIARSHRHGTQCAVVFLDLDRFKDINDTLGHEAGDGVLRAAARRISAVLGTDGTAARWGGDEFIAIVPRARDEAMERLAQRFITAIAEPFVIDDVEYAITVSAGIAVYPRDGVRAGELIRNADTAMYTAKHDVGRGYAFFSDGLRATASNRQFVQNELRRALAEDRLTLHYQPVVDGQSGDVVGAEALVRWIEPNGTLRMPGEFIAIAEESRIIVPLGAWVLRAACAQAAAWQRSGLNIRVAVNVSPRQFIHDDFTATLAKALTDTGADPERLELEITEAAIMSNVEPVLATLQAVHRMGVSVAIDDFGTGYSSFAYLKRFDVNSLKIDRTFVEGIEHEDNLAIARSIVSVAHALGMPVTAEGVETPMQARILADLGCDRLQGYHFGHPAPATDFEAQLQAPLQYAT
jgi:diguanylate cyclase (GGDEF)-like protein